MADFTFPKSVQGRPTRCLHAFFAGYNLPEFEGCSFGPARDSDEITVWIHDDDGPTETAGTFTEWLNTELGGHEERMAGFDDAAVADLRAADAVPDGRTLLVPGGRRDPHCLLRYSLGGSYDQAPYTAADLDLTWVVSGDYTLGRSARLKGLIDGSGTWLIPLGDRFRAVRPFRDGVAEVILDTGRGSHVDEWTRIRPDGSIVIER